MSKARSVTVKDIVDQFQMEVLYEGADYATRAVTVIDINRPGLQFAGFFDYFDVERLQIIGKSEVEFLRGFSPKKRRDCFSSVFHYEIPALIVSRNLDVYPECLEMARYYGRTLLRTKLSAVEFTGLAIDYLNHQLAPMVTRHGVLLDVYGEGVIIMGESGIGKSETAIELIKRGHRLVADDAVEIRRIGNSLIGSAPELIRGYLEVRGVGVIDIQNLFGMGAVQESTQIDLIIRFEEWADGYVYDRLGLDDDYMQILDVSVPCVTIPVRAGRNLAGIAEIAAMNNRQKKYGFNAAQTFVEKIDRQVDQNSKGDADSTDARGS